MTPAAQIPRTTLIGRLLDAGRRNIGLSVGVLVAFIAIADFGSGDEVSLGVLYVLPVMVAATAFSTVELVLLSAICAVLRGTMIAANGPLDSLLRGMLAFSAYIGTGLFIVQLVKNRTLAVQHVAELKQEEALRLEAEDQMKLLAESSPAAIFTLDENASILTANDAAREMLGFPGKRPIQGQSVGDLLPILADALKLDADRGNFRTAAQSRGRRVDGREFVAHTWFSTYRTPGGAKRLAAIAVDYSEEVREREEQNLQQLLDNNRIIAAAVSHEIRNVCGAVSLVYSNLRRLPDLGANEDFQALGTLVATLERIASTELQSKAARKLGSVDLGEILGHLNIVIEPAWSDQDGMVRWKLPPKVPHVVAEPFGLMQAFLNLTQNSLRAVQASSTKELAIETGAQNGTVTVSFSDSGPGVRNPQRLFEPFQQGSDHVGLGLYVSRAILRSYGGDLRYEPVSGKCRFVAYLQAAGGRS